MMESSRRGGHVLTTIFLLAFCFQVYTARAASPPALSAPPPSATPALLNSYLPAAMQVLAHLTHQMSFERPPADSQPAQASRLTTTTRAPGTTKRSATTTTKTETTAKTTAKTTTTVTTTTAKPTTASPVDLTTPPHAPANFAPLLPVAHRNIHGSAALGLREEPLVPPIVLDSYPGHSLLTDFTEAQSTIPVIRSPYPHNSPHYIRHPYPIQEQSFPVVLFPSHTYFQSRTPDSEPMFLPGNFPGNYNQDPLYADYLAKAREGESEDDSIVITDGLPDVSSLPVQNENNYKYNPLELMSDELSDENLQYLAPSFRELIKGINAVDDREEGDNRYNPHGSFQSIEDLTDNALDKKNIGDYLRLKKAAATQSYIQMLLLYDLLSRDAKTQKLNNYTGYSKDLLKDLVDLSQGTAAEQLATILNRMVLRGDCKYDFANNRAKELVTELGKPGSKASMEVRYLEPLRFLQ